MLQSLQTVPVNSESFKFQQKVPLVYISPFRGLPSDKARDSINLMISSSNLCLRAWVCVRSPIHREKSINSGSYTAHDTSGPWHPF